MPRPIVASVVAVSCVALACAGPAAAPMERSPETPAALSRPEPDPACHGTVQGLLAQNDLETLTVKVALDATGRVEIVEVLAPDLTPAAKIELQRAFAGCAWAPVPSDGRVEVFTTTWFRDRIER